jgi:hypothetical protein
VIQGAVARTLWYLGNTEPVEKPINLRVVQRLVEHGQRNILADVTEVRSKLVTRGRSVLLNVLCVCRRAVS